MDEQLRRDLMQFRQGQIKNLTYTPNKKKDPTISLALTAELTPELAEIIGCRESVFRADGKPHAKITRQDLGGMILRDIDLSLPSPAKDGCFDLYRPEDIASFRIETEGMLVRLCMLVRIKGRYEELAVFTKEYNTDHFDFAVRTAQQEFDWSGKGGTGTKVALSDGTTGEVKGPLFEQVSSAGPCILCHPEIPKNEDGMHMKADGLAPCENASNAVEKPEAPNEPALPAMHIVGSGRGPKQRSRRQPVDSPELRGDIAGEHHPVDGEPVFPVN